MSRWPMVPLGEVLTPVSRPESVQPRCNYRILGAHWYAGGLYIKQELSGAEIRAAKVYRVEEGDFVYNRLFAWKGSFAIATKENHGCCVSNEFPCFRVSAQRLEVHLVADGSTSRAESCIPGFQEVVWGDGRVPRQQG